MTDREELREQVIEAIDNATVHGYSYPLGDLADAAIAACEPAIRADERRKVLNEAESVLDGHPRVCDIDGDLDMPTSCGWKAVVKSVEWWLLRATGEDER